MNDEHSRMHAEFVASQGIGASPDLNYPPLMEQAGNALAAAGRAIASGFARVDQAEQGRRLTICRDCEWFDKTEGRCSKCGCLTQLKTWLSTERCPIAKW